MYSVTRPSLCLLNARRSGCTRLFFTAGVLLAALVLATSTLTHGEEPEAIFDKKLVEGYEPATLIEGTTSADEQLSVIFVARKKNLKPAKWPSIIPQVSINGTTVPDIDDPEESLDVASREGDVRLVARDRCHDHACIGPTLAADQVYASAISTKKGIRAVIKEEEDVFSLQASDPAQVQILTKEVIAWI